MGFYIRFWFKGKRYGFISKTTLGNSRKNTRGENLNSKLIYLTIQLFVAQTTRLQPNLSYLSGQFRGF